MSDNDDEPKTVFLKRPAAPAPAAPPVDEPPESRPPTARLICFDSVPRDVRPDKDEYWLIGSEEIIGRGPDNTVQIRSPEISREHARFLGVSGKWAIEDRGSRNGVWINGTRVVSRTELSDGDTINLGRIAFRFEVSGAAPAEMMQPSLESEQVSSDGSPASFAETIARNPEPLGRDIESPATGEATAFERAAAPPERAAQRVSSAAPAGPVEPPAQVEPLADLASSTAALREHLPEILSVLVAQARKGDAGAARVCLDYLNNEQQRLPVTLERTGSISGHVKTILTAMMDRKITPRQALEVLQVLETAGELLKKRQG
ncbi:MAG TPA: FHA domain-containing protein [Gammaproteobacteria bacterium]